MAAGIGDASTAGGLCVTLAVCTFLTVYALRQLLRARASRGWPTAEGRIVHSSRDDAWEKSRARIRYTYVVDGRAFAGSRVSFDDAHGPRAWSIVQRYSEGQGVDVRYAPEDPSVAVLEPGPNASNYFWVALLIPINLLLLAVTLLELLKPA